jgi:hypothetical protein
MARVSWWPALASAKPQECRDDVIRDLLKLPRVGATASAQPTKKGWTYKGVTFPHGTELRANYKGEVHTARINDGEWIQGETPMNSPSEAAHAVTGNGRNGWTFWEARLAGGGPNPTRCGIGRAGEKD